MDINILESLLLVATGIGMGFSVMGISTSIIFSPIIISIYGSKFGNGIFFIPFFITNLYMAFQYRKSCDKKIILKLLPFSLLGMILASIFALYISEDFFRRIIGIIIILTSIMFFLKKYENRLRKLSVLFGIIGGASSYLANISGPIFNLYFLSYNKSQKNFIGTRSVFFAIFSIIKLLMYIFIFKNINIFTLSKSIILLPTTFIGAYLAKKLLEIIDQKTINTIIVLIGIIISFKMIF